MTIKKIDSKTLNESIIPKITKNLEKKPLRGGIPAIEKKIKMKARDQTLFFFKRSEKLEIKRV